MFVLRFWQESEIMLLIEINMTCMCYALCCVATAAYVIIAKYYTKLRGEAITKIDIGAMMKYWDVSITHVEYPHVLLIIFWHYPALV